MVERGESSAYDSLSIYLRKHDHPFKLSTLVIAVCAQVNPTTRRSRVGYVGKLDSPLTKLKVTAAAAAGCTCIALIPRWLGKIESRKSRGRAPRDTRTRSSQHIVLQDAAQASTRAASRGRYDEWRKTCESAPSGLWSTRIRYM